MTNQLRNIIASVQDGEITVSRALECIAALEAGNYTDDWLPPAAAVPQADLHAAIMNLPCSLPEPVAMSFDFAKRAYKQGHRDARHAAAELVLSAVPEQAPQGYKLVPITPTKEMLDAARMAPIPAVLLDSRYAADDLISKSRYSAMLNAAPPAPQAIDLTDEQIANCIPDDSDEQFANDPAGFIRNFARAVLAARGAR